METETFPSVQEESTEQNVVVSDNHQDKLVLETEAVRPVRDEAMRAEIARELKRRRTFAIISHPDAGKTTLTEKLLLYSGMIRTAGMVGGRKHHKGAVSDWMSMEQERGISITASAMQFEYKGSMINILDTPGHQDFSEDTYRTLTAADSVIMVIDAAKGVEPQTIKLFQACRLRRVPVFTFVNKMDMESRNAFDLMAEVEEVLGIRACAATWAVGMGRGFQGVIDLARRELHLYSKTSGGGSSLPIVEKVLWDDVCQGKWSSPRLSARLLEELIEEVALLEEAGDAYDPELFLAGEQTPVFFGSAIWNFGVEPLFDAFIDSAPPPHARFAILPGEADSILKDPVTEPFSSYVFKIQANMNPRHRDCVAFMRINTGRFEKDMLVQHDRLGRKIRLSRPHSLLATERNTLEFAYPGDVIGVINPGMFQIGDTLSERGGFEYLPLPQFQPEFFMRISPTDAGKRKAFDKGIEQLVLEGAVQILYDWNDIAAAPVVGAVGKLQFEVLEHRLNEEYGVTVRMQPLSYTCSTWLEGDPSSFIVPHTALLMRDRRGRAMVLFNGEWDRNFAAQKNSQHRFVDFG